VKTVLNGELFLLEANEQFLIHGCLSTKYKLRGIQQKYYFAAFVTAFL